jgi:Tfp pilus tip-associated adhesin PilY1
MNSNNSLLKRLIATSVLTCMVGQSAVAANTDISAVPLATSGGSSILPNLLFTLDDSFSMTWDFMPDYVNPNQQYVALTAAIPCMNVSGGRQYCVRGDPPYEAGGAAGFNGIGYDPNFYYRPGITSTGAAVLNPLFSSSGVVAKADAYTSTSSSVNLTNSIQDVKYCNSKGICKRNGADASGNVTSGTAYEDASTALTMSAGLFPYRTNPANASTAVFGLPEMMSIGTFSQTGTTVSATTLQPHGLTTSDKVYVTGTSSLNATCVAVASVPTSTTFTYALASATVAATAGSYRKCVSGSFTRAATIVTVNSPNHGLVVGDVITTFVATGNAMNGTSVAVLSVTDANNFAYTSSTSGALGASPGFWVRNGLYNVASTVNGPPLSFAVVPVEYCSDQALTNCAEVIPPATPPGGFIYPAYVRFCQTQEQALSPGAISDPSNSLAPRCRAKYNETTGFTQYVYARYGWFRRDTITSSVANYVNRPNRTDCAAAPSCTYNEELTNYATWYAYYRTRIQMMKTSLGLSLLSFIGNPTGTPAKPNALRLGYITINFDATNKYLKISDFNTTQASNFYTKLYNTVPPLAGTPLQAALARAGWIYAGKLNTGLTSGIPTTDDPIQAACQRNFTLLTTDGYWNYLQTNLPQTLGGKTIGNLDASPQTLSGSVLVDRSTTNTLDGLNGKTTTFTPTSTTSEQVICQGNNPANFTTGAAQACACGIKEHKVTELDKSTGSTEKRTNGVLDAGYPMSGTQTNYVDVTSCVPADWVDSTQPLLRTEVKQCDNRSGGSVTFADGTSKTCGACATTSSGKRYVLIRERLNQTQTTTYVDGSPTPTNVGPVTTVAGSAVYAYSNDGGASWSSTAPSSNSSCTATSYGSPTVGTSTVNNGTASPTGSGTGTPVSITLSPNPSTTTGGTATTSFTAGGTATTLADVALYYYQTKLRGGSDVNGDATGPATSPNTTPANTVDLSGNQMIVKSGAKDFMPYQHMVTFGIGLADGFMHFQQDYETSTSGDYANIKNGISDACFWSNPGTCNWAAPFGDSLSPTNGGANLDDLWHAAVNGRGTYYQALNPDALRQGISTALSALNAQVAAAAASATSSPNVTQTENQIFSTTYETNTWSGKVFGQEIDPVTGNVLPPHIWDGDIVLLSKVGAASDTRNIVTADPSSTNLVKQFTWANLNATEQGYFSNKCSSTTLLAQCSGSQLTSAQKTLADDGSRLVGYLRGWQQDEGTLYRDRQVVDPITGVAANSVLGDTISAKPVYVKNPTFSYVDAVTPTYASFVASTSRQPRVYVGANDGFVHAFDGNTGDESWSYLPRFLMAGLPALANTGYNLQHQYFVDGSPESFDVYDATAGAWKTILIGGSGGGGNGFYALDITNESSPKGLWEFCSDSTVCTRSDADLGLSYGNPVVGKRSSDGKWVVVLTSGLNNSTTGTGHGFFYVLDVITGQLLNKIDTGVGSATTPSGLMKMAAFYDSAASDATFEFVYGGDQLGNIWRLDMGTTTGTCAAPAVTGSTAPCVTHVATLKDGSGFAQPITTRPALTHISGNRVIYIGTGRYLGNQDLSDTSATTGIAWQQTFYGFKDKNADYGTNLRTGGNLVVQTLTKINNTDRGITSNPVDWNTKDGWLVDFNPAADPSPGERVNIDPRLVLGTLKVATNIPAGGGACAIGGTSRVYDFDFRTGSAIVGSGGVVGRSLGATIAVGMAIVQLPSGAIKDIVTGADTSKTTVDVQIGSTGSQVRRFSYRER